MPFKCKECGKLLKPKESCCGAFQTKKQKKKKWNQIRPIVKPWFIKAGINQCELQSEVCNITVGDGFAHTKKQRLLTEDEKYIVAYLCNPCHNTIEGKPDMEQIILAVRKRNPIPEINEYIKRVYG
jgi:hypothetical protein